MQNPIVTPIPAFTDNYIWCIQKDQQCWVVDPGDAKPVIQFCKEHNLTLTGILITHHHWDHTGGIADLLVQYPSVPIVGPSYGNIQHLTQQVSLGDSVMLTGLDITLEVIEVPGHTLDHIAYHGESLLFCGDTLFSVGCGRLFEGTPEQMLSSLQKLMQLHDKTVVYCTHEYTLANINFAEQVEPQNQALHDYKKWAQQQREKGLPTLPTTIQQQKAINPFLRAQQDEIKHNAEQYVGTQLPNEEAVFTAIRQWKDNF